MSEKQQVAARDPDATHSHADSLKVSDYLIARLRDWGISRVYGYSGDGINGLLGALGRAGNRPEFVQPVHEELCGFMASAHAKFTGQIGVCLATQGPGAIHLLNGLYDAKLDHQPVLAILGQVSRGARGSSFMQEVDLVTLFKDVAHEFVEVLETPEQARHLVDRAIRIALAERTVTAIIVPHDVQQLAAVPEPERRHGRVFSSIGYAAPQILPNEHDLACAAEVLNAGRRVALLVGAGALGATDEVIAVAERLGAGVAKALLGKAAVPDELPFVTGTVGWLGTRASNWMMQQCDTLLIVGSGFPYTEFLPVPGQARCVQIDIDGRAVGARYPCEVHLIGDCAKTLSALLPKLNAAEDRSFSVQLAEQVQQWHKEVLGAAWRDGTPVNPYRVFWELSKRLPDDCIFCGDSGSSTFFFAQTVGLRRGMKASLSGTLASMGSAIPYALAAKLNYPERPVVAVLGDGALQMSGVNALITVAQRYREWSDPRFVVLVLNNRELSYVTWEQRVMEGDPKFGPSQDLFDFPVAEYAKLLGLEAVRIEDPSRIAESWDWALGVGKPAILEVISDPNVPPLPPQLTPEQKEKLTQSLEGEGPAEASARSQLAKSGRLLT